MPSETASGRLKKQIMFMLLKKLGINKCWRCSELITDVKDLSIEHKKPWLDSKDPIGLYFDLDNIAFSHIKCNIGAARKPHKIIWEEGKMYCWSCKRQRLIEEFPPSYRGKRGKACSECHSKARTRLKRNNSLDQTKKLTDEPSIPSKTQSEKGK